MVTHRTTVLVVLLSVTTFFLFEAFQQAHEPVHSHSDEEQPTTSSTATGWRTTKQNEWLHGDCPLNSITGTLLPNSNKTGWIEIYQQNQTQLKELLNTSSHTQHLKEEPSCWGDAPEVCSSCCDGLHRGCGGERKAKDMTRRLKGKMELMFPIAIKNGQLTGYGQGIPYAYPLTKQGISTQNEVITSSSCTIKVSTPVMLIVSGRWTQATSAANAAHWIAEIFGPLVQAAHTHGEGPFIPIVTFCEGASKSCSSHHISYSNSPLPHWRVSGGKDDTNWPYKLPGSMGIPWLEKLTTAPKFAQNDTVCVERFFVGCPQPMHCPAPKFVNTMMPLMRGWLREFGSLRYDRLSVPKLNKLVIINRRPGGTRYIANSKLLLEAATRNGWDAMEAVGSYNLMLNHIQNAALTASFHGADLALTMLFMRDGTALIEILLNQGRREDPWYVYQANGAPITIIRWILHHTHVPEWITEAEEVQRRGKYKNRLSWRRKAINFTLPVEGWQAALQAADLVIGR
eukprot:TRINITY_DN30739_c0_g1_i1.p1 TRINITY_DN30739_c0_g1~~TRINITY_DN30739_c0_g1_i1.p1  ORF type:complete len:513 (+),score=77.40 TRINITY_DN30739_c0_g1_i1:84-1622(+)